MNSKSVYSTVLFSFIFLTSLSCKKEPAEAEAVVKEAEKEEIIDPFYAVLNEDSSLEDYWNVFVADAIRSGKLNPDNGKVITLFRTQLQGRFRIQHILKIAITSTKSVVAPSYFFYPNTTEQDQINSAQNVYLKK